MSPWITKWIAFKEQVCYAQIALFLGATAGLRLQLHNRSQSGETWIVPEYAKHSTLFELGDEQKEKGQGGSSLQVQCRDRLTHLGANGQGFG